MIQQPVAIDLTVCEQLIVEEKTRNITLVNCFTRLRVREVPSAPQHLIAFASLTDGMGDGTLSLVVLRPDTLEEIFSRDRKMAFRDPLEEVRIGFRIAISFPIEGRYQVNLLIDGKDIGQRVFQVSLEENMP